MSNFRLPADPAEADAPTIVMDTNVVLDWLVFQNPPGLRVGCAVSCACVRWVATREMRDELEHVLARGTLDRWSPDPVRIFSAWTEHAIEIEALPPAPRLALRCSDADDQKFIALALQVAPARLLSRDRAVLKLARQARAFGLSILTPAEWLAQTKKGQPESCP